MRNMFLPLGIMLAACSIADDGGNEGAPQALVAANGIIGEGPERAQSGGVVPRPAEEAQLDRMISAGYTPHGDHMHPPGIDNCPLAGGNDAVM